MFAVPVEEAIEERDIVGVLQWSDVDSACDSWSMGRGFIGGVSKDIRPQLLLYSREYAVPRPA